MYHIYGVMSVNENRDLSRAAAERSYLLQQAVPEGSTRPRFGWSRRRARSAHPAGTGAQVRA